MGHSTGMCRAFARRITGSPDLYHESGKGPECSISYVTCHDGFTLNDLVSYSRKHNDANGESNRDGSDANYSANYGVEGPTEDVEIELVRRRQIKNFLLTLFVSRGIPMLLGGDEFRRTQHGNNNAYCQDNETGWWLWDRLDEHAEIHRFTRHIISLRQSRPSLHTTEYYTDDELQWFGPDGHHPDWDHQDNRQLGCRIAADDSDPIILLFNADTGPVDFTLPTPPEARTWHRRADTFRPPPEDIHPAGEEIQLDDAGPYTLGPRSSAILLAL